VQDLSALRAEVVCVCVCVCVHIYFHMSIYFYIHVCVCECVFACVRVYERKLQDLSALRAEVFTLLHCRHPNLSPIVIFHHPPLLIF
jgi:hypothetical protein